MKSYRISDIRAIYERLQPDGHFFDYKTLKFFGDTSKNFGVCKINADGLVEFYRKKPVKHGLTGSWMFCPRTGKINTVH
jgi:hypothetical protein